jgi:hypothetical protein
MAEQHLAHGQAAKHSATPGEHRGLQTCHPTSEVAETQQQAPRRGVETQRGRARADRAAGARSTGRQAEVMASTSGESDKSPHAEEAEQMPHAEMAELAEIERQSRR